MAITQKWRSHK